MARKDEQKGKPGADGNNRIQGFVFGINLEGTEEVVTEGIKAFTHAFSHMSKSGVVVTSLSAPKTALLEAPKTKQTVESEANDSGGVQDAIEQEDQSSADEETEATSSSSSDSKRTYSFRKLEFLDDLDLTKATKPVSQFMAEKGNPSEMMDRYIAAAVWLKEYMQIEEFTIDHIYTVFGNLGWKGQIPVDHSTPLRSLKSKRHFLTQEKGAGYKVNWQGIQYVENLGASK